MMGCQGADQRRFFYDFCLDDHVRFRGYLSVHFRSGLQAPYLRFAVTVTGHHARLGTRLLARPCRGGHPRPLNFMRLQGATLIEPDGRY